MDLYSDMVKAQKFDAIISRMSGTMCSWAKAKHIVGGEGRLTRLMEQGKIHGIKPDGAPNSQWLINAEDVFANVKPMTVGRRM